MEKHSVSRLSYLFAHLHLLSSDSFSSTLLSSNLSLLSASALLFFSSVHIVGSLTSKLPSIIYESYHFRLFSSTFIHFPIATFGAAVEGCMAGSLALCSRPRGKIPVNSWWTPSKCPAITGRWSWPCVKIFPEAWHSMDSWDSWEVAVVYGGEEGVVETETSEGLPLLSSSPNTTVPCFLFFTVYTDTLLNCSSITENSSWAYASSLDSRWAPQDGIQVVCGALVRAAAQLSSMDYWLLGAFLLDSRKPIAVRSSKISKIWREVLTCFDHLWKWRALARDMIWIRQLFFTFHHCSKHIVIYNMCYTL